MNDDDLSHGLEAWASTTDPAGDPITLDDVSAAEADGIVVAAPRRSRPWLTVAAALVVVLGLGAALVVATRGDDGGDVVTDEDGTSVPSTVPSGPGEDVPVQVVLVNDAGPDVVLTWRPLTCGEGASCQREIPPAIDPGSTSLVLDTTLDHPLVGRVLANRCTDDACPERTLAPGQAGTCTTGTIPLDRPTRLVLTVVGEGDGVSCSVEVVDTFPSLTVPPAFSLRSASLVDCGVGAVDAGGVPGPSDPTAARDAFACLTGSVGDGETVELDTSEGRANDTLVRSWWRVLPEPVDGRAIEVFRDPGLTIDGWARVRCTAFSDDEGGGQVVPGLEDCTDEEPLSLDPPLLGEPTDPPATTPTSVPPSTVAPDPPTPGTVDVVLDADELPQFVEGGTRRWSASVVGNEVASGPLTEPGGTADFSRPDVQLVGDDVAYVEEKVFSVTVEDYDCFASTACRRDGMGPTPGAEPLSSCLAEAPADRTGPVLLVTLRGDSCNAEWVAAVPALTVPPAWSTRPTSDRCADADWDTWQTCLRDALDAGETAEWTENGDGARITHLVSAGEVQVVWRRGDAEPLWTIQRDCTTLAQPSCGPEEPMSFDP